MLDEAWLSGPNTDCVYNVHCFKIDLDLNPHGLVWGDVENVVTWHYWVNNRKEKKSCANQQPTTCLIRDVTLIAYIQ